MSNQPYKGDTQAIDANLLIHRLWTKAVGAEDYVKQEWKDLERAVNILIRRMPKDLADDEREKDRILAANLRAIYRSLNDETTNDL